MTNLLSVFFLSMLPFSELTGSIPFGIAILGMSPWVVLVSAVAGTSVIAFLLLNLLEPATVFLRKHSKWFDRFCEKLFQATRAKHSKRMAELGHLFLFLYLAIPNPGSGAWSACLLAYLFDVPKKTSYFVIISGLTVAGALMAFGTEGILKLFG